MKIEDFKLYPAPLQRIEDEFIIKSGINLFVKREDLIHPAVSGNKWYKLKYNLLAARKNYSTILTFGGAYSNHIYAAAYAGRIFNFKTIGIIRGEEHLPLNPTLSFAIESGMEIHYMNRTTYRRKGEKEIIEALQKEHGPFYLLPEGGTNILALKGCKEILDDIEIPFDYICVPCGTGGTFAGIISALEEKNKVLGFSVLKGAHFLTRNVEELLLEFSGKKYSNWIINLDYHFGGYAKFNDALIKFIKKFYRENNILLEPIYSGKMFFGIYDLISKNYFAKGDTIVAVHTGGLQGLKGLYERIGLEWSYGISG